MTIDEAIKSLTGFRQQESSLLGSEFTQATQLGIEALERHKLRRQVGYRDDRLSLPSETEE